MFNHEWPQLPVQLSILILPIHENPIKSYHYSDPEIQTLVFETEVVAKLNSVYVWVQQMGSLC